jgi:hypothetical protein
MTSPVRTQPSPTRAHPRTGGTPVSVWRRTEHSRPASGYAEAQEPASPATEPNALVPAQRAPTDSESRTSMSIAAVPSPTPQPPSLHAVAPSAPTPLPRAGNNADVARVVELKATTIQPKNYRIIATPEIYEFTGRLIGFATSEDPTDDECLRWTEIYIYSTIGGNYISHVIGRSLVYHDANNGCRTGKLTRVAALLKQEENPKTDQSVPCPICTPLTLEELPPTINVRRETDRHTVRQADDVKVLVANLQQKRQRDGSAYLSTVSQTALAMAAQNDPSLGDTRMTIHVR